MNVVYVNKNDKAIGSGSIDYALDKGIIMRISRVFLANSNGKLLLQKRSDTHKSLPGRLDQTAAGHVDEGEGYLEAAARELLEEMGIKDVELQKTAKYYTEEKDEARTKKRFNVIFTGTYDGEVKIDQHEVSDFRWVEPDQLLAEVKQSPNNFTEGFIEAFKIYRERDGQKDLSMNGLQAQ